jgi:hypothetical protein
MITLGSQQALRMEPADTDPPEWEEGESFVSYGGKLINVYWTASDNGVHIDGIEHAGLVLEDHELSAGTLATLARLVREQWDMVGES